MKSLKMHLEELFLSSRKLITLSIMLSILSIHFYALFSLVRIEGVDTAAFSLLRSGESVMISAPLLLVVSLLWIGVERFASSRIRIGSLRAVYRLIGALYPACAALACAPLPDALHNAGAIGLSCAVTPALLWCATRLASASSAQRVVCTVLSAGLMVPALNEPTVMVVLALLGAVLMSISLAVDARNERCDTRFAPQPLWMLLVAFLFTVSLMTCSFLDEIACGSHPPMSQGVLAVMVAAWLICAFAAFALAPTLLARQACARRRLTLAIALIPVICVVALRMSRLYGWLMSYGFLGIVICSSVMQIDASRPVRCRRSMVLERESLVPLLAAVVLAGRSLLSPYLLISQSPYALACFAAFVAIGLLLLRLRAVSSAPEARTAMRRALLTLAERFKLSQREQAVLQGMVDGDSLQLIAEHIGVARATAGTYATRAYRKLGVSGRSAALELAEATATEVTPSESHQWAGIDGIGHVSSNGLTGRSRVRRALTGFVVGGLLAFGVFGMLRTTPLGRGDASGSCFYPALALGVVLMLTTWKPVACTGALKRRGAGAMACGILLLLAALIASGDRLLVFSFIGLVLSVLFVLLVAGTGAFAVGWCAIGASGAALFAAVGPVSSVTAAAGVLAVLSLLLAVPSFRERTLAPDNADHPLNSERDAHDPLRIVGLFQTVGLLLGGFGIVEMLSYPCSFVRPFIMFLGAVLVPTRNVVLGFTTVLVVGSGLAVVHGAQQASLSLKTMFVALGTPFGLGGLLGGSIGMSCFMPLTEVEHGCICIVLIAVGTMALCGTLHRMMRGRAQTIVSDQERVEILKTKTNLTQSEATVALMLARGWRPKRIAQELVISPQTVATHRKRIYRKLGIHSQDEVAGALERWL